ncbi:transposase [candidate division KSB1 bacterium]
MNYKAILESGKVYHIYNRAIGNDKLFLTIKDYHYFLKKYKRYISPFVRLYAYCLIPNHFHLLARIKNIDETPGNENLIQQSFSNFFNSYTKSFNKIHFRYGKLFDQRYKRIRVDYEDYFNNLIYYIHRNPIHHGLTENFSDWQFSSYRNYIKYNNVLIAREEIFNRFGGKNDFINFHKQNLNIDQLKKYTLE